MSYMIDSGIWSSVFAVPASVVDDHIRMCSPLSLKILLVMLRHPGVPVDAGWLSAQLNISPADITDALGYWIGAGIVSDSNRPAVPAPARPEPSAQAPAPAASAPAVVSERKNTETGQKLVTISSRPKISREDIAELSSANPTIGQLLQEAQQVLGAPLTPVESEILTALCSYYGLHPDVVLMLLQYCVSIGHKSMNFVEKTAASWIELGITTHEQVEQEIVRLTRDNENESKIVRAFQLYGRGLTSKEKEYVARWFALGLDEKILFLACERSVENTGKASFAYADKLLTSWKSKGISTIKAALDDLNAGASRSSAAQNKSARTGGDSSIDMSRLHEMLHSEFRD